MAVQFFHCGKRWQADTPEEAIRLRQQLEVDDTLKVGPDDGGIDGLAGRWSPEVFATFLQTIGEKQKAAVSLMAAHAGIGSAELAERLKLDSQTALAGVISGLSKQLRTLDLEPGDLYKVKTRWNRRKKEELFFLRESFRRALVQTFPKGLQSALPLTPIVLHRVEMSKINRIKVADGDNDESG